jgi:hypothetical protein
MAAAIAAYAAAFNQHKLAVGEVGTVLVLAASQAQAQTVFQYALGFLEASEVLRREIASVTATEIRLRSGIVIAVHPNSFRTLRGKSLLCCVMDEVSMWRSEESATPDVEVYRAVLPSLATTNGMLIAISTPYRKSGLLYQKHRDCFARDSDGVLVVQGPSLTFNPTLNTAVVDAAIADDREGAASEWEATFRTDISALLDDATIDACIGDRPLELPPSKEFRYSCFVDSSAGRHDSFCCALAHKEGETCVIDLVRGRSAPFDPDQVAQEYAQLAKEYKCTEIVGDNFAGEWVAGAFKRAGIRYRRADKVKSQIYLECLPLFARGQLNLPDHPKLMRELRLLERHTARSGKDRVDHGRNGSDDYANAAMGALVLLTHARMPNYPYITDWDGNLVFDGRPKQSA